eukprot:2411762-Pleurochrysis_carterae.AAC.1
MPLSCLRLAAASPFRSSRPPSTRPHPNAPSSDLRFRPRASGASRGESRGLHDRVRASPHA